MHIILNMMSNGVRKSIVLIAILLYVSYLNNGVTNMILCTKGWV